MTTPSAAPPAASTPYNNASLYVGDLSTDVTEATIFDTFNSVGPVQSVRVCRDNNTRRSLGYAYVNFHRVEDADRALQTLNFQPVHGKPCRIMWSQRDPVLRKSGAGNIFINGLAPQIDNKSLYDTFSTFGNILSCKVAQNKKGESLGYGFVHYESEEAARSAITKVDGKIILEFKVKVLPFKSRKERQEGLANKFTNIFVKNIPEDITEEKFKELFSQFGTITSLKLGAKPPESKSGKKRTRYGFINYESNEQAVKAIEDMNEYELGDEKLFVGKHQKKEERERELRSKHEALKQERRRQFRNVNLYVKNLADDITDEKLAQNFSKYGTITSSKVMVDRTTGKTRGFGFVCFSTPDEATVAVTQMNGRMVDGKPLYVTLAQNKEERRAQLEAQYANRGGQFKQGGASQMYRQAPMFYSNAAGMPPPVMYSQQMNMGGRWMGQGPQMMRGQVPLRNAYTLMPAMPVNNRQQGGQGGQNRRGRGARQQGNKQGVQGGPQGQTQMRGGPAADGQARYNSSVRNQMGGPVPSQGGLPQQQQRPQNVAQAQQPLNPQLLAAATAEQKKQMIGERLFPLVQAREPEKAGKITGMLLEMDDHELISLLESGETLEENIKEALAELERDDDESDEESDEEDEE